MLGDVWFIAHSAAVAFTLLALAEASGAAGLAGRAVGGARLRLALHA